MDIVLLKGITNFFEIEIINFMIDTSYRFVINNTDIKIQKGVLFTTSDTTFQQQGVVVYVWQCHQNTLDLLYSFIQESAIVW